MLDQLTSRGTLYDAFSRVRDNAGCRGSDGITVGQFQDNLEIEIDRLQDRLLRRVYHPLPLLQFQVPKPADPLLLPQAASSMMEGRLFCSLTTRNGMPDEKHAYDSHEGLAKGFLGLP